MNFREKSRKWLGQIFNSKAEQPESAVWNAFVDGAPARTSIRLPLEDGRSQHSPEDEKALEEAFVILSQSRTGRWLLDIAREDKYTVIFQEPSEKDSSGDVHVVAGMNGRHKRLIIQHYQDPAHLVVLLTHELAHVAQKRSDAFGPDDDAFLLDAAVRRVFASEADARAHEVQVALELRYGDPRGPEDQWRTDGVFEKVLTEEPIAALVGQYTAGEHGENLDNGMTMAVCFEMFYSQRELRRHYAESVAEKFETKAAEMGTLFNFLSYRNDLPPAKLAASILHRSKPYLVDNLPDLDLGDAHHSGVPEETAQRIIEFHENLDRGARITAQVRGIPVYEPEPPKLEVHTPQGSFRLGGKPPSP